MPENEVPSVSQPEPHPASRLIVALDFPTSAEALLMVDRLDGQCRWFKVGLELYLAEGRAIVDRLKDLGFEVFLDLKLHDIPNTVAAAVRTAAKSGPSLLTLHAAGGSHMMRAAVEAVADLADPPKLLAVTVLTSMDEAQLRSTGVEDSPRDQVLRLGRLANDCGMDGLICSGQELAGLRQEIGSEPILVVPGIRPAGMASDDQKRTMAPADALHAGASMLVVGRPITRAADPARACAQILAEIAGCQK